MVDYMNFKFFFIAFSISFLVTFSCGAAESISSAPIDSEEVFSLSGAACERIKPQETISSIRLRATDKATFNAVQNLEDIKNLQNSLDSHDLNVLIYDVVDNFVEDLAVQTTQQNNQKICVQISGFVTKNNLTFAQENLKSENIQTSSEDFIPQQNNETPLSTSEPIQENDNEEELSSPEISQEQLPSSQTESMPVSKNDKYLYIAPLEFFNNTKSEAYAQMLTHVFENNPYFNTTNDVNEADYIIYPKVLRAKVDAVNENTNRMQMVLSVEVKFMDDNSSAIEHQNQFILFSSSDDEQKVAARLMKKLLNKAGKTILNKVEKHAASTSQNLESADFITPDSSNPTPSPYAQKQEKEKD